MTDDVVVLGSGYAGAGAIKSLESEVGSDADITWISDVDYHLVLHESHRCIRNPEVQEKITFSVSEIKSPSTRFVQGRVEAIDTEDRQITLDDDSPRPGRDLRTSQMHALCVVPAPLVTGTRPRPDAVDSLVAGPRDGAGVTADHDRQARSGGESAVRADQVSAWLDGTTPRQASSSTHPPTAARVERLRQIAGELEQ